MEKKQIKISGFTNILIVLSFLFQAITPAGIVYAQPVGLPSPQTILQTTQVYSPTIIKGLTVYADNPLEFDFFIVPGEDDLDGQDFEDESSKIIKYFLAALTVPEEQMWVNLSPYEKDRIIPKDFGLTEMGRDLLAQDYLLKQLSASLMYPEKELGQEFWDRIYEKAVERYGSADIPMNTFNKIWIIPEKAVVYESGMNAFVVESHLKIMMEEDYVALQHNIREDIVGMEDLMNSKGEIISGIASDIVKDLIIPEIEKEVNEGETFANLRQIFQSMILASWYKQRLKESLLGKIYVDKSKVKGVDAEDKDDKEKIYQHYMRVFKEGVYDYVKDSYDPVTQQIIPRKYFSGGGDLAMLTEKVLDIQDNVNDLSQFQQTNLKSQIRNLKKVNINLRQYKSSADPSGDNAMLGRVLDRLDARAEGGSSTDRYLTWTLDVNNLGLKGSRDKLEGMSELNGFVSDEDLDVNTKTRIWGVGKARIYRDREDKNIFYKVASLNKRGGFKNSDILMEALFYKDWTDLGPLFGEVRLLGIGMTTNGEFWLKLSDRSQDSVAREKLMADRVFQIKPNFQYTQGVFDFVDKEADNKPGLSGEVVLDHEKILALIREFEDLRQVDGDNLYGFEEFKEFDKLDWQGAYRKALDPIFNAKETRLYVVRDKIRNLIGMILYSKKKVSFDSELLNDLGKSLFDNDVYAYYIDAVEVLPSSQGQGLATKMVAHVARASLADETLLYDLEGYIYSEPADSGAKQFHDSLGFKDVVDVLGQETEGTLDDSEFDQTGKFMYLLPEMSEYLSKEELNDNSMISSPAGESEERVVNNEVARATTEEAKYGGIDLNPVQMSLEIRRDRDGAPLPISYQPIDNINVDGFIPVIVNISSVSNLPFILK